MSEDSKPHSGAPELRQRAEAQLSESPGPVAQMSESEIRRTVHELQVYQIELELQNEELRAARGELEASLERFTDLYDFAPLSFFTFDRQGVIARTNLAGAALLRRDRVQLQNVPFESFVPERDQPVFRAFLHKAFASAVRQACEITLWQDGPPARVVTVEGTLSSDGEECRAVVVDITEHKSAEQQIQRQLRELQRWHDVTLGREERIQALKAEVKEALTAAGQPPRYSTTPISA